MTFGAFLRKGAGVVQCSSHRLRPSSVSRERTASALVAVIAGSSAGLSAWRMDIAPLAALALGMAAVVLASPLATLLLMWSYMLCATWGLAAGLQVFLVDATEQAWGLGAWAVSCVACAVVWASCQWLLRELHRVLTPSPHLSIRTRMPMPVADALGIVVAQALLLTPPMWSIGVGQPVQAAGYAFPGWGFAGAAASIVAPASIGLAMVGIFSGIAKRSESSMQVPVLRSSAVFRSACVAVSIGALTVLGVIRSTLTPAIASSVWTIDTYTGAPWLQDNDLAGRLPTMARQLQVLEHYLEAPERPKLVVWPESTIAGVSDKLELFSRMHLQPALTRLGASVIFGADRRDAGTLRVAARLMTPQSGSRWINARQPMPVMLWKPWHRSLSFEPDRQQIPVFDIPGVGRVVLSFCFEDTSAGMLMSAMTAQPDVIVSIANNWWARPQDVRSQSRAIESMALLYAVPLSRAVNHPVAK